MASPFQLPTQQASLFGKLPTVLDYVRINHSFPAAIALDEWLSRALQDLTVASLNWPAARYRFLFAPAESAHAVVGVFGPSRDRAGRKFPLSVFAPIPVAAVARDFAVLPWACAELFRAADQLLDEAATLSREEAADKLAALPLPTREALDERRSLLEDALARSSLSNFTDELFNGSSELADDAFARARGTFASMRDGAPERPVVLDCPVASTTDVAVWLSLAEDTLGWRNEVPSLFWTTASEPGRLLLSLGAPQAGLPLWLADRKRKSDRLIPLAPSQGSYPNLGVSTEAEAAPEAASESVVSEAGPSLWDKLRGLASNE